MSDCNKKEKKWYLTYYAEDDFDHENPIVEYFPTKEAVEEREWELTRLCLRRRRFRDFSDRQLLDLIADKVEDLGIEIRRKLDELDRKLDRIYFRR